MRERERVDSLLYLQGFWFYTDRNPSYSGLDCMNDRAAQIESCIKEVQEIYEAIESLVQTQDGALLDCMGDCIEGGTSSDSGSNESDSEDE